MTDQTQPAAQPADDQTKQPGPEAGGAQKDELDTLLSEFESSAETKPKTSQPETAAKPGAQLDPADVENLKRFAATYEADRTRADVLKAVASAKQSAPALSAFDDDVVEAMLNAKAQKDPRLQQAWLQRHQKPMEWNKVMKAVAWDIAKGLKRAPDEQLTADREAARAAVSGRATEAPGDNEPSKEQLRSMPGREFRKLETELYAQNEKRRAS